MMSDLSLKLMIEKVYGGVSLGRDETRMLIALRNRSWIPGDLSFKERIVLASYDLYPDDENLRYGFIKKEWDKYRASVI
jgi:hypothetical protein